MITPENRQKLWIVYLKLYDPTLPRIERKNKYGREYARMNLPGCGPCQTNSTFTEFESLAEDLSPEEITNILNSNPTDMPIKKAAKKADAKKATKAVTKPKKVTVTKPVAIAKKPTVAPVVKETVEKAVASTPTVANKVYPGGVKFLYIPKRK